MAELIVKVSAKTEEFDKALAGLGKQTEAFEKKLAGVAKISGAAFAGLSVGIGAAVNEAAKFETISTQFEVLTGSVETAKATIEDLSDFTAATPFQFEQVAAAGKQLLGFGFQADDIKQKLQEIGDVAAASGAPINDLSLIFGQVSAAGKLTGERLLQLQERAIPIGPALAKTLGVAESAVKDLVSEGAVDFATFEKAFASLSEEGGFAFGGLEKQSQTLQGVLSTLGDNFSLLAKDVGEVFLPDIKDAAVALTEFIQVIRENREIVRFGAILLGAATAVAGIVAGVSTGIIVFAKLQAALAALNIVVGASRLAFIGLAGATGIGLVLVALSLLATHFEEAQAAFNAFKDNVVGAAKGLGNVLAGVFTFDVAQISAGIEEVKAAVNEGLEDFKQELRDAEEKDPAPVPGVPKPEEVAARGEAAREEAAIQGELMAQEAKDRDQKLREEQEEIRAIREEEDFQRRRAALEKLLSQEAEFQALSTDQQQLFLDEQAKRTKTQALTLEDARRLNRQQDLEEQIEFNNRKLREQERFGAAFSAINSAVDNSRVNAARSTAGELARLATAENAELKAIGKAAAVAQITINSARSAVAIYRGFVETIPFPPVSIPLGVAGAAAAIAFGALQIDKVLAAQTGGVVKGGVRGVDSVPALLTPGELIVPDQNFEEVINAVSNARTQDTDLDQDPLESTAGTASVIIGFDGDEASQVLTAKQIEDRSLGISRENELGSG